MILVFLLIITFVNFPLIMRINLVLKQNHPFPELLRRPSSIIDHLHLTPSTRAVAANVGLTVSPYSVQPSTEKIVKVEKETEQQNSSNW